MSVVSLLRSFRLRKSLSSKRNGPNIRRLLYSTNGVKRPAAAGPGGFLLGGVAFWRGWDDIGDTEDSRERNREEMMKLPAWERVKIMWAFDPDTGGFGPEVDMILDLTLGTSVIAGLAGGLSASRNAVFRFMEENKGSMFMNPRDAQRQVSDQSILYSYRGFMRWALKVGPLTFLTSSFIMTATVARGYFNPLDSMIGFSLMGVGYNWIRGPKAMLSGAFFSSIFGLISGVLVKLAEFLTGDKVIDSFSWKRNQMIEKFEKQRDKEADVRDQYGVRAIDTRLTIDALVPEDAKNEPKYDPRRDKENFVQVEKDEESGGIGGKIIDQIFKK